MIEGRLLSNKVCINDIIENVKNHICIDLDKTELEQKLNHLEVASYIEDSSTDENYITICSFEENRYVISIVQKTEKDNLLDCGIRMLVNYLFQKEVEVVYIETENPVYCKICRKIGFIDIEDNMNNNKLMSINEKQFVHNLC